MNQYDPQRSLDDIRRYGDRSRDAYVRHAFAWPYVLIAALMVFVVYAAIDFPRPWSTITTLAGVVIGGVTLTWYRRHAPVRRKPSAADVVVTVVWTAVIVVGFGAARIGAWALGLPLPGLFAAGALALLCAAGMLASRPLYRALLKWETGRG